MSSEKWSPDYENYDDGPSLIRTSIAMTILATLFVGLRLWARRIRKLKLALDDFLILISLPFLYALLAFDIIAAVHGGVGRHLDVNMSIDDGRLGRSMMYLFIVEFIYGTMITLIKVSILSLYFRTFATAFVKRACYVLGAMALAWWLAVVLIAFFQCRPMAKIWSPLMVDGACIDVNQYFLGNSISNIIIDVLILTLPIITVSKLQMKPLLKISIISIFLLGSFVIITSGIRLQMVVNLSKGGPEADYTFLIAGCWIWTHVEVSTAMICACLPTMRPLAFLIFDNLVTTKTEEKSELVTIRTFGGGSARGVYSKQPNRVNGGAFKRLDGTELGETT
ncbi:uncharacterized protein JN550_007702 [Neoarthrinium moseri]|uniref:uncharacterized protein n=1 Tax=Neoarthrinium moseri TaxID=1658444 RepID=UPI001FDD646E|nr:uncharacterized protein JN550_007702 [Neoarthrinium moseri]KAI1866314.1 hypothetical protein JN550_007702 [Neoarthrinium moseri]